MNGQFIVFTTVVLVLYIFIILLVLTPWYGISMIPYLVIFTLVGAAIIIAIFFAYDSSAFDDMGWETVLILILIFAALIVAIFVLWYFIRKYSKEYARDYAKGKRHHHHHQRRDPMTNSPIESEPSNEFEYSSPSSAPNRVYDLDTDTMSYSPDRVGTSGRSGTVHLHETGNMTHERSMIHERSMNERSMNENSVRTMFSENPL